MRGRRHVGEVELGDLGDGREDVVELSLEPLDLVLAQLEAREPRDVDQLFPIYGLCFDPPKRKRAPAGALSTLVRQVL